LFSFNFQKEALLDNIKSPLFKQEANKTMKKNINNSEEEMDTEETLEAVVIESLTRIDKLTIISTTPSMILLHGVTKKK
jgi:hypothetical protein